MKFSKFARYYAITTQGLITIVVLLLIGYYIGVWINKDSAWPGILAAVGAISGIVSFIYILLKMLRQEDKKNEPKNESED